MSLHIPKIALNILQIGEGGLRWCEEEREGACGRGEAHPAGGTPYQILQLCFSDHLHAKSLAYDSNLVKHATFKWWLVHGLWLSDLFSPSHEYQSCSWWYSKHV